jgi:hypothetical protein
MVLEDGGRCRKLAERTLLESRWDILVMNECFEHEF